MSYILGVSAYYHDSAAALVRDGEVIAAAQEERFSRKKHDPRFPMHAINYCLGEAFIDPDELDAVVFYDNPLLTLDRLTKSALATAPASAEQFSSALNSVLGSKALLEKELETTLGQVPELLFTNHHLAHGASCFYPSPFERAAILTIDGVGEWSTSSLGLGQGSDISIIKELKYPHSIGLLYSAFTYYCGFKVNSGEYKLMGLSPYGEPRYADLIRDKLIDIKEDGSLRLNMDAFGFMKSHLMTNPYFDEIMGGEARRPESTITRREMDLAASVQLVVEEVVLKMVKHVTQITECKNLTLAGGVALNCVANGRILRESKLDNVFVQPAAGDAGGALGAALFISHQLHGAPRSLANGKDSLKGSYLGPAFSPDEVEAFLERSAAPNHHIVDEEVRASTIADALADGLVVGLFNGRMEFGPRALGARSIIGDPRSPNMQSHMNLKIKYRESFRPFAPAVLQEYAKDYFSLDNESPYMLFVAPIKSERQLEMDKSVEDDNMLTLLNQARSDIPAVTHIDYSARVQTVSEDSNPEFRRILQAFNKKTNCPVLINTSFNVRGEPIVCSPQDAYTCFMNTDMDVLVMEDRVLWKKEQPEINHLVKGEAIYELD